MHNAYTHICTLLTAELLSDICSHIHRTGTLTQLHRHPTPTLYLLPSPNHGLGWALDADAKMPRKDLICSLLF